MTHRAILVFGRRSFLSGVFPKCCEDSKSLLTVDFSRCVIEKSVGNSRKSRDTRESRKLRWSKFGVVVRVSMKLSPDQNTGRGVG